MLSQPSTKWAPWYAAGNLLGPLTIGRLFDTGSSNTYLNQ